MSRNFGKDCIDVHRYTRSAEGVNLAFHSFQSQHVYRPRKEMEDRLVERERERVDRTR